MYFGLDAFYNCVVLNKRCIIAGGSLCIFIVTCYFMCLFRRNLDLFETCQYNGMVAVDCDHGNGEVTVKIPPEAMPLVAGYYTCNAYVNCSFKNKQGLQN